MQNGSVEFVRSTRSHLAGAVTAIDAKSGATENSMATILDFDRATHESRNKPGQGRPTGTAEIIIFPGVRIERHDEGAGNVSLQMPPAARTGRQERND